MILFERRSGCKCVSLHQQPQRYTLWLSLAFQAIQILFIFQAKRKGWWGFVKDFFWSHSGAVPQSGILSKTVVSRMNFSLLHAHNIVLKVKQRMKGKCRHCFYSFFFFRDKKAGALLNVCRGTVECVLKSFRNSQLLFDVDRLRCRNAAVTNKIQMSPAIYYWNITA